MGRCSCPNKRFAWKRCLVDRLCCAQIRSPTPNGRSNAPSPTSSPSSNVHDHQNEPPSSVGSPNAPQNVSSDPAFEKETSLENLDVLLDDVMQALKDCDSVQQMDTSNKRWIAYKERAESFMKTANDLERNFTETTALLKAALSGLGHLHWVAVGFSLVAWSLDRTVTSLKNRDDCFRLLRRTANLLKLTKTIWKGANEENVELLHDSVEKSFRCAIICSSLIKRSSLLRFLTASTIKDAIADLHKQLDEAYEQTTGKGVADIHADRPMLKRQLTYTATETVGACEEKFKAIAHLDRECSDLVAVCLHGMGGIGKSTTAVAIFAEFQQKKYQCCSVELPLGIKDRDRELPKFQKHILEILSKRSMPEISNTMDGIRHLKKELQRMTEPVFLYLDNVWEPSDLTRLLPLSPCFPIGSRILITTRHEFVRQGIEDLEISHYKLIEVKKLKTCVAKELLWKHVLKQEAVNEESEKWEVMEKFGMEVLRLCDGLPLALKVVGRYISAEGPRDVNVWRRVIEAMEKAEGFRGGGEDELRARINFSIVDLDEPTRKAFLDVVVFASNCLWEDAESMVAPERLKILKELALVERREEEWELEGVLEFLGVHDVLKEIGLKMAEADEQEIRVTSQDVLEDAKSRVALQKVVALEKVEVESEVLQQMPRLRLLIDVEIRGECPAPAKLKHLSFVEIQSVTARPFDMTTCTLLKHLSWRRSKDVGALPWSSSEDALEVYKYEMFQKSESLPEGMVGLTNLRRLDLGGCSSLRALPEGVAGLTGLHVLALRRCSNLQTLPGGSGVADGCLPCGSAVACWPYQREWLG